MIELIVSNDKSRKSLQHRQTLEAVASALYGYSPQYEQQIAVATSEQGCYLFHNMLTAREAIFWLDLPCRDQALYRYQSGQLQRSVSLSRIISPLPADIHREPVPVPSVCTPQTGTAYPMVRLGQQYYAKLAVTDNAILFQRIEEYYRHHIVPLPAGGRCIDRGTDILVDFPISGIRAQALFWQPHPQNTRYDAYLRHRMLYGDLWASSSLLRYLLQGTSILAWTDLVDQHGWPPILIADSPKLIRLAIQYARERDTTRQSQLIRQLCSEMQALLTDPNTSTNPHWLDLCDRYGLSFSVRPDSYGLQLMFGSSVLREDARIHRIFWMPSDLRNAYCEYYPAAVDCTFRSERMILMPVPLWQLLALPYRLAVSLTKNATEEVERST